MITVNHLSFTYPNTDKPAVKGISFGIDQGEILGFLGPSGAGKSTTQKILIGLLKGYQGQVSIMGRELTAWGQDYYERIGVSFELPNHYQKLTGLENLKYFASLYHRQTEDPRQVMEWVGLGDAADVPVAQYSKGMKNRLNVARSLLHRPDLLFMDEPTSGLDPVNARLIKDLIQQKRAEGTTVFVTTHNMAVADELCDRVAFIVDGEIKLIDAPKTLKVRYGQRKVLVEYFNGTDRLNHREFALDNLGRNTEFLHLLNDDSSRIETIHTQETSLENIFIQVTGRELA
jgi:fluoroquinolone transport system ATP-binding protein